MARQQPSTRAVVVLGCRLAFTRDGALAGAAGRRVRAAAEAAEAAAREGTTLVVASGGRVWNDVVEADGMKGELCRLGVAPGEVVVERCSQTTRENARFTAALLGRRGVRDVLLVTCDWHVARAARLFRRLGLRVDVAPVTSPPAGWSTSLWRLGRERVLLLACVLSLVCAPSCKKHTPSVALAVAAEAGDPPELRVIATAEDQRRSTDIPEAAGTSHDVRVRRRVAEALARIADADAEPGLLRALSDEDPETETWGAYGLGFGCKGREDRHVRALAARAASLDLAAPGEAPDDPRRRESPRMAIARAVGRCGGAVAEQVLVAWVRAAGPMAVPGAYGLGDVARARGGLTDNAASALLDAGEAAGPGEPLLGFLYPFGRGEQVGDGFASRVLELARRALPQPSELRRFAIRALARSGRGAADDLARLIESKDFSAGERAEASRGLSLLGEAGRVAAGEALARLTPDKDPLAITALGGDEYGVLLALLESFGGDSPKEGLPALRALATMTAPGAVPATLARRISELRCRAAALLANGAYDADVLKKCDLSEGGVIGERAKLVALGRRPLVLDRRAAWMALAKSPHVRVREDALEAISRHPELGDAARTALTEAIASGLAGVVATAADIVQGHPDRVMVLSAREIRSALDPAAPPPTASPSREVDRATASALEAALKHAWTEDLVETRVGLLDAAAAVRLSTAHDAAEKACHDRNATVREHAAKDLRILGDTSASCPASGPAEGARDGGTEPRAPLERPTKVTFETDAGELSIVFEPSLAPIAAARFVELARKGFYKGIAVHRVVPGFVAQFGDPEGDGFGGSGALLRCETAPVPFGALDVGVALSGRDTGSSQLFVTLGRYPHLDGEYARVGFARGDWGAVAEGDVVREVKVED